MLLPGLLPAFRSGLRSFLAAPLVHHDAVIGVFQIRSKFLDVYSQRHLDLEVQVANQIAGAIANAQLFEQSRQTEEAERQRSGELRSLLEVASVLNHPGSFESQVSMVMEELARVCDARLATFRVPMKKVCAGSDILGNNPSAQTLFPMGEYPGDCIR